MTVGRLLRGSRAAVFTVACVALSAAGHVWMSGRAVPPWALAAAAAGMFAAAWAIARHQRGFAVIAALMLAGELGQHVLFSMAQGGPAAAHSAAMAMVAPTPMAMPHMSLQAVSMQGMPMPGMPMSGMSMQAVLMQGVPMSGMPASPGAGALLLALLMGHGAWGMVAVHAAAGLLCAGWLCRGESAVFRLLLWLVLTVLAPLRLATAGRVAVACGGPGPMPARRSNRVGYARFLASVLARRGPPRPRLCF